jgi:hypothetical protein
MVVEIWTNTSTSKGRTTTRYYYFNRRVLPIRKADALAKLANGTAVLVERPEFLPTR